MFVLAGVGSLFRAQSHTVKGQESKMEANEYALTVLDMVVREVRNAGYFSSTVCPGGSITSATATSLTIQYDKNSTVLAASLPTLTSRLLSISMARMSRARPPTPRLRPL